MILRDFYEKLEFRGHMVYRFKGADGEGQDIYRPVLRRAADHGLNPEALSLYARLSKGVKSYQAGPTQCELEVMMSRAFARYAADINAGRIGPNRAIPGLYVRAGAPRPRAPVASSRGEVEPNFAKVCPTVCRRKRRSMPAS